MLTSINVDFKNNKTIAKPQRNELIAYAIDKKVDAGNRIAFNHNVVLVHCAMGVSRSASCVIMTIMKMFHIKFNDVNSIIIQLIGS